ncbi:hypothetical protein [Chryseobacterium sp. OSA05B]|uniref:beta strand repeat-containing protein n=1 Tax=Chryseobacterium sp. OSA05B TaxID=2862650 RepID=UPI001CC1704B|nr:hypothetical protein [Chryseobacterium sp. OSA05B]
MDRQRAQSMGGVVTSTLLYVDNISTGTQTGIAVNIDATGYYYYNGTVWTKLSTSAGIPSNIYNTDGLLTGNRIVTQGSNTLAFIGTANNSFSVDGTTLSVDAANNKVGIGTTTPVASLEIGNKTTEQNPNIRLQSNSNSYGAGGILEFRELDSNYGINIRHETAQSTDFTIAEGLHFNAVSGTENKINSILSIDQTNRRIGIGATAPLSKLVVNGDMQLINDLKVGGSPSVLGNAGITGQVLTSGGAGSAPTWTTVSGGVNNNIYNADGTLLNNRTVTQGTNTLTFTGGNVTNGFSIDGNTFSLDALNNRLGIGTTTPQRNMHVNGTLQLTNEFNIGGNASTAGSAGTTGQVLTSGGAGSAPTWTTMAADANIYNTDGVLTSARTVSQGTFPLSFTGNNAANGFSVDGTTFSVDAANNRIGLGTITPQKNLHVNGTLQVTNELSIGGNATTAGNAGIAGQFLSSNGPGVAPTWQSLAGIVPTSNGTVIAVNGQLLIAQEITAQLSADFTISSAVATPIGNLNVEIIDNEGKYNSTATTNSFTVSSSGVYQVILNMQLSQTAASNPVIGVWDDTTGDWVVRGNDLYTATEVTGSNLRRQTYTVITSVDMNSTHTYSFRIVASAGIACTVKAFSAGATGSGAISQVTLKRLK